jgi:hypothetical protein
LHLKQVQLDASPLHILTQLPEVATGVHAVPSNPQLSSMPCSQRNKRPIAITTLSFDQLVHAYQGLRGDVEVHLLPSYAPHKMAERISPLPMSIAAEPRSDDGQQHQHQTATQYTCAKERLKVCVPQLCCLLYVFPCCQEQALHPALSGLKSGFGAWGLEGAQSLSLDTTDMSNMIHKQHLPGLWALLSCFLAILVMGLAVTHGKANRRGASGTLSYASAT